MNEAALIQKIRKYLATVPECFFWKEHGGQYGTAGIPDIIVCHKGRFIELWQTPLSYRPLRITGKRCDSFGVIRDTKRPETRKMMSSGSFTPNGFTS